MKKIFLLVIIVLSFITSANAQLQKYEGEFSMIRTKEGIMVIYNADENSFTVDISCKEIKEIDSQDMIFLVDNKVLQFTTIPTDMFNPENKPMTELDMLVNQMEFEQNYVKSMYGDQINFREKKFTLKNGRVCYAWDYRMPRKMEDTTSNTVRKQFSINTNVNKMVVMISSVATLKDNDKKIQDFLKKVVSGLKPSSAKIDVEKLRESLKAEK